MNQNWTPKLDGQIFCSPACGRGCTLKQFNEANTSAKNLAKKLGPNWRPVTWENLGWHWKIVNANMVIEPYNSGKFNATLHTLTHNFKALNCSAEEAVKEVLKDVQFMVEDLNKNISLIK